MKKRFTFLFAVLSILAQAEAIEVMEPVSTNISKRTPIELPTSDAVRTYATSNQYYFTPNLKEGMRVLFSASYGIGGEAAQMSGTVVLKDGKYWFKPKVNPTLNLLLPPGFPLNSGREYALWDLEEYMHLINRVAFSEANLASNTSHEVYTRPEAALVDFRGGTASQWVDYYDALEVSFKKKLSGRSDSSVQVYYAKGIGPVTLEFRENLTPAGTYKFYLGE